MNFEIESMEFKFRITKMVLVSLLSYIPIASVSASELISSGSVACKSANDLLGAMYFATERDNENFQEFFSSGKCLTTGKSVTVELEQDLVDQFYKIIYQSNYYYVHSSYYDKKNRELKIPSLICTIPEYHFGMGYLNAIKNTEGMRKLLDENKCMYFQTSVDTEFVEETAKEFVKIKDGTGEFYYLTANRIERSNNSQKPTPSTVKDLTGKWSSGTGDYTKQIVISDFESESFKFYFTSNAKMNFGEIEGTVTLDSDGVGTFIGENDCQLLFADNDEVLNVKSSPGCNYYGGMNVSFSGEFSRYDAQKVAEEQLNLAKKNGWNSYQEYIANGQIDRATYEKDSNNTGTGRKLDSFEIRNTYTTHSTYFMSKSNTSFKNINNNDNKIKFENGKIKYIVYDKGVKEIYEVLLKDVERLSLKEQPVGSTLETSGVTMTYHTYDCVLILYARKDSVKWDAPYKSNIESIGSDFSLTGSIHIYFGDKSKALQFADNLGLTIN